MIGNMWEWCSDWYDRDYYKNGPKINPQGPSEGKYKVLRGWAWNNRKRLATITRRHKLFPGVKSYFVGFRCVESAGQK
jgi:formylglycine-generating enzyme required for sulfatase activity